MIEPSVGVNPVMPGWPGFVSAFPYGVLTRTVEPTTQIMTLDRAKQQVFKLGLVMFTYHKESRVKSEVGKDVRKGLKNLWELHSVDEGFKKYFGEEREKELQTMLAVDTAETSPQAPAKQGEPGGRKPPEGKRAPAAVAATEAARPRASGRKQWRRQKRPGLPTGTLSAISAL
jgi:hypothetical protein